MLIGVRPATTKMAANARTTAAPPTISGIAAATTDPKTMSSARAAERQRDQLAAPEVRLGHRLHVAVERGAAGQAHLEPGRVVQCRAQARQRSRRIVGGEVEQDDVVRRVAVGRDLAGREGVRQDAADVRSGRDIGDRRRRAGLERGLPGARRFRVEHDDDRGLGDADLGLEQALGLGRLEVVTDEPAGAERAGRLEGERDRDHDAHEPGDHDEPSMARAPPAETLESAHVGRLRIGSTMLALC